MTMKTPHERGECDPWECEHPAHHDPYAQREEEREEAERSNGGEGTGCYCVQCLTQCFAVDLGQREGLCAVCSRGLEPFPGRKDSIEWRRLPARSK